MIYKIAQNPYMHKLSYQGLFPALWRFKCIPFLYFTGQVGGTLMGNDNIVSSSLMRSGDSQSTLTSAQMLPNYFTGTAYTGCAVYMLTKSSRKYLSMCGNKLGWLGLLTQLVAAGSMLDLGMANLGKESFARSFSAPRTTFLLKMILVITATIETQ